MQKLKGLWIPVDILLNEDLSDKEKIILSMILYLSEERKSCFASNKYIANIVNVTHERVSKIISALKDKGYVSVKLKPKKLRASKFLGNGVWGNVISRPYGQTCLTSMLDIQSIS